MICSAVPIKLKNSGELWPNGQGSRVPKVLIACEISGIVRGAFERAGFDAWSCDLLPADHPTNRHIVDDVRNVLAADNWHLLIVAHPPCTRLCNSGVRWLHVPPPGRSKAEMWAELDAGAALFSDCWQADIPHVAVENPVMHKYAKRLIKNYQPPAQSVQPWQFGSDEAGPDNVKKRTCFWLRALPKLVPTGTLDGKTARAEIHKMPPGKDRRRLRSKFYPGIAEAMAEQWGWAISGNSVFGS